MFSTVDSLISWFQFNFFIKYFLLTIFPMKKSLDQHTDRPNPTLLGIFHDENGFGKNIFKIYYSMFLKKCLAMTKSSLFILIQLLPLCMPTFPETLFLLHIHSYVLKIIETKNWSSFLRLSECWDIHLHVDVGNMWIVWLSFKDFL